jgi:release factor glutamine methyltransferase
MSENSLQQASIHKWLQETTAQLPSTSPRLDALLMLSDTLHRDKAWLLSHTDELLDPSDLTKLSAMVNRRLSHEPMAYIRGKQAFYGREFVVSPAVLIPRPETETLIEELLKLPFPKSIHLLDVGTGSGSIAISASLARPNWNVTASDISNEALAIAQKNAQIHQAHITFIQSDLLEAFLGSFDCIIANLPYVAPNWEHSPEIDFEPEQAIFAANAGLFLIDKLLADAPLRLVTGGYVILEADPRQHAHIVAHAQNQNFRKVAIHDFIVVLQKL